MTHKIDENNYLTPKTRIEVRKEMKKEILNILNSDKYGYYENNIIEPYVVLKFLKEKGCTQFVLDLFEENNIIVTKMDQEYAGPRKYGFIRCQGIKKEDIIISIYPNTGFKKGFLLFKNEIEI